MAAKKDQIVPVEIAQVIMYWTCPHCKKENTEDSKRNGGITELECEQCGTVIKKKGEVQWLVSVVNDSY